MASRVDSRPLELWGGVECSVVRIGDAFRNQICETGHYDRPADLDAIAALGIRTLRYPILWETVAPEHPDRCDWTWCDQRLSRLRDLRITPIAGLVHHGSGPRYTGLLDPDFPALLARHAAAVAARYPWIEAYTPINEPLTTARFGALYGHWRPHERDFGAFLRALVTQCQAVVLAMRAIRRVRPDARLVQTEDLGKTFSTPLLRYQAKHENERRWLTFDLLCGRIDRQHPWRRIFADHGVSDSALELFLDGDGAPDILGVNHYLTSDRFLDQRLRRYPNHLWGGNGRHRYADAEAVRMPLAEDQTGPAARLREIWSRYRRPVAVTEAHHGCTREEQLRWLMEVWDAARALKAAGADVRAVTIWSLLGAVDWNVLLMRWNGFYEPGAFDIRGPRPRPTAIAKAAAALVARGTFSHPTLAEQGWWRRGDRFYQPPGKKNAVRSGLRRMVLITGGEGKLARAFSQVCQIRGLTHVLLARGDADIADAQSVARAFASHRPWAVVNAAGYARVARAEQEPGRCFRENAMGAATLARACARSGVPFVTFSSAFVFDGRLGRPYVEADEVQPTGVYGASKVEAERRVLEACSDALVIRAGPFFGPWGKGDFVDALLNALSSGSVISFDDRLVSPTYMPDLAHATLDLLIDEERGIWHLANQGVISRRDFAHRIAREAGLDRALIRRTVRQNRQTALSSERGLLLPTLDSAITRYFKDSREHGISR